MATFKLLSSLRLSSEPDLDFPLGHELVSVQVLLLFRLSIKKS